MGPALRVPADQSPLWRSVERAEAAQVAASAPNLLAELRSRTGSGQCPIADVEFLKVVRCTGALRAEALALMRDFYGRPSPQTSANLSACAAETAAVSLVRWYLGSGPGRQEVGSIALLDAKGEVLFDPFLANVIVARETHVLPGAVDTASDVLFSVEPIGKDQLYANMTVTNAAGGSIKLHARVYVTLEVAPYIAPITNDAQLSGEITVDTWISDEKWPSPGGEPVVFFGDYGTIGDKSDPYYSRIAISSTADHFQTGTYRINYQRSSSDASVSLSFSVSHYVGLSITPSDSTDPIGLATYSSSDARNIKLTDKVFADWTKYLGVFGDSGWLRLKSFLVRAGSSGGEVGGCYLTLPVWMARAWWYITPQFDCIWRVDALDPEAEYVRGHKIPDPDVSVTSSDYSLSIGETARLTVTVTNPSSVVGMDNGQVVLDTGSLDQVVTPVGSTTLDLGQISPKSSRNYSFTVRGAKGGTCRPQVLVTGRWGWPASDAGKTFTRYGSLDQDLRVVPQHTLSLSGSHGRVRVDGTLHGLPWSGTFAEGTRVTLEAVPDSGYRFDRWSGDLGGSTNPQTLTMDRNKGVAAAFIATHKLNLSGSNGRVKVNGTLRSLPWSGTFDHGAGVTLEAVPDSNYRFDHWSGDLTGSANPQTLTMDRDKSVTAHFAGVPRTLSLYGDHGRVRLNGSLKSLPWSDTFDHGTRVTLEAVADTGYRFDHWSGSLGGSSNPQTLTMDGNKSVTAHFVLTHTLSISGVNGRVKVNGTLRSLPWSGTLDHSASVVLEAVPDANFRFDHWSGDMSGSSNPATLTMDRNKSVTAHFGGVPRTLSVYGDHGRIRVDGSLESLPWSGTFDHGTQVKLEAVADSNYRFDRWSGDLSGDANPQNLTMDRDRSVTAHFTPIYTLSISGSNGKVKVNGTLRSLPWSGTFEHNASVLLEAVPDANFRFDHWSGDLSGSANPATLTMDRKKSVTAHFRGVPRALSVSGDHGRVKVNASLESLPWSGTFEHGTRVTLEAVPDSGYCFDHWSGDLSGSANPQSLTMDRDKSVTAHFALKHTLALSGTNGKVKVNGTLHALPWSGTFDHNASVTLEAVADSGYRFERWAGDLAGGSNPTSVAMDADKTVAAHFIQVHTLTVSGSNGQVKVNGTLRGLPWSETLDHNAPVTLEALPDSTYRFEHWSGSLTGSDNPETLTMDSDKTVTAHFGPVPRTLTLSGTGGCVKVNGSPKVLPWSDTFDYGTTVVLEATPDSGYRFGHWSGDLTGSDNPRNLTLDDNKAVTAHFMQLHTLSLSGSNGHVKVNGTPRSLPWSAVFDHNTPVTLEAIPDAGYRFDHWSGAIGGDTNPASVTMDADKAITPRFGQLHTLSLSGSNGRVKVNGTPRGLPWSAVFDHNTPVTLEAIPDAGYRFDHWSGALDGGSNPASVTMDADKAITPHFVQLHTLSLTGSNGRVKVNGTLHDLPWSGPFDHGASVTLEPMPDPGYRFDHWSGDYLGIPTPPDLIIDRDKSITLHFIAQHTLSVAGDGGQVKVDGVARDLPWNGIFDHGVTVVLEPIPPDPCHRFDHWSGDLSGSADPVSVTIDGDKQIVVHFTLIKRTLTATVFGHGRLQVSGGVGIAGDVSESAQYVKVVGCGTRLVLEAIPDRGYVFDGWSGDLAGDDNPATLVMDRDKNVGAHFSENQAPSLEWVGAPGYDRDGVGPDKATPDSTFTFKVKYVDPEGDRPYAPRVIITSRADGSRPWPKHEAVPLTPESGDPRSGQVYSGSTRLPRGLYRYRFFFRDDTSVAAGPASHWNDGPAIEAPPELLWWGSSGYERDGVQPDKATSGAKFMFTVRYRDCDGDRPDNVSLVLERINSHGEWALYRKIRMLSWAGPYEWAKRYVARALLSNGVYRHRFEARDDDGLAVGEPTNWQPGPVIIAPPILTWSGLPGMTADACDPDQHAEGGYFNLAVRYFDSEGDAPVLTKVLVRRNDGSDPTDAPQPQEYALRAGDGDWQTGRVLEARVRLEKRGQYWIKFVAEDNDGAAANFRCARGWSRGPRVGGNQETAAEFGQAGRTPVVHALCAAPSSAGVQLTFALAAPASVSARIMNIAGRPVRTVCRAKECAAGTNTLVWNAQSDTGLAVPNGAYVVEVVAKSSNGSEGRAVAITRVAR